MLLKYFILTLLILHVSHAEEDFESSLKSTSRDVLKKRQRDLEDTIQEKFKKLEKSIIDTLEEYLDGKLDILQKNLYRKIDSLEENIPDKTDIFGIERDLEALKNGSVVCGSNTLGNGAVAEINTKLNKIHNDVSELAGTVANIANLGDSNITRRELQRLVEAIIKPELDALNKKIPDNLAENTNLKFNAMEKQIVEFNKNVSGEFDELENTLSVKLDEIKNEIPVLEQTINSTLDALRNSSTELRPVDNHYSRCQTRVAEGYDFMPVDINTLKHTTVQHDASGLSRLEMHLAIKGSNYHTHLQLSPKENPSENDRYIALDFVGPEATVVRSASPDSDSYRVQFHEVLARTGGIRLSSSTYTPLHIIIDNGILTMGLEGSLPAVRYVDSKLREIKYIGFTAWRDYKAEFLYDCPAGFEESLRAASQ